MSEFHTPLGVKCQRHNTFAEPDEPCWSCEHEAEPFPPCTGCGVLLTKGCYHGPLPWMLFCSPDCGRAYVESK